MRSLRSGLVLMLALMLVAGAQQPVAGQAAILVIGQQQSGSSCTQAGGAVGRIKLSTKLATSSVTLCADWMKLQKPKLSKPTTGPAPKPVPKVPVKNRSKPPTKSVIGRPIKYSHSVVAEPAIPRISAPSLTAKIDESMLLGAITRVHYRYRYLLGVPTQVRFSPIGFAWSTNDGRHARGKHLNLTFNSAGSKVVRLRVRFAVAFRVAGATSWRKVVGSVAQWAMPVVIQVGLRPAQFRPRYVAYDCRSHPSARGCSL